MENAFEFFTVAVIAYAVLTMGLLPRRLVERTVYFELILIFGAGIIGTGHHLYWVGDPAAWLALGAMFGLLEVIPLGFMMVRAWREYRAVRTAGRAFPQRTAFLFFTGAAVWNIVGAGVLGGILNPPLVNYYEHGTFLTLAHAHASLFGVFGMLALGLVYLGLRGRTEAASWDDRLSLWVLRSFHAAIALWLALNLLPIGVAQVSDVLTNGYAHARSLAFYDHWTLVQWFRLAGDGVFLAAGALLLVDVGLKLLHPRRVTVQEGERLTRPRTAA